MAKSNKKCSKNKHGVKSHRRMGKLIRSHCSKNPKHSKRRSNRKCSKKRRSKCRSNQTYVKPFMTKSGMTKGFCAKKRSGSRRSKSRSRSSTSAKDSFYKSLTSYSSPKISYSNISSPKVSSPKVSSPKVSYRPSSASERASFRSSVGGGVGGCKAIKTEAECGYDPRCSYVNGACRAAYASLQGVQRYGPMGPPSARLISRK
jgi:hypothetical protein